MSRLLVLGVGPLAPEEPDRLMAPGLRTWSFAEQLAARAHEVTVVEALFGGEGVQKFAQATELELPDNVELWRAKFHWEEIAAFCRDLQRERSFDGAIATTDLMCRALAEARLSCPIWLDFNGHPMAERQLLADVYGSDDGLRPQWEMVVPCLLAGDRLSSCSAPQRHALLGELALAGRLNEHTDGVDLVVNLPPVTPSLDLTPTRKVARGVAVPDDAFIVLWTGGYNTWTDTKTLFDGLVAAMEREPRLRYVSTGGAIEGHDDRTFRDFTSMIETSPLRDRFTMAGWVALEDVANYYAEADVAINIDADTVEARLGHRNRVTEWILAGTPVVSTPLSDFTRRLADADALTAVTPGDANVLCEALLDHASDTEQGKRQNANARAYLEQHHAPEVVYRELYEWAERPEAAADLTPPDERDEGIPLGPSGELSKRLCVLHANPPAPPRRLGLGLGVKPRIERWLRRIFGTG